MVQKKRILGVRRLKREGPREKEIKEDNFPKVNVIVKGDVLGSVEAIMDVLDSYSGEKQCKLSVVHYGVGPVTETDLELARTFDGKIINFNKKLFLCIKSACKFLYVYFVIKYTNFLFLIPAKMLDKSRDLVKRFGGNLKLKI